MSERLPPLTALRAFEAAARHLSFAKAAEELSVTPAALSFQIKSLEEHLGQPVFRRLNRAVELTEAGRALQPGMQEGFAALNGAWRVARKLNDTKRLTVTAGPGFTSKWLAPRLFKFAQENPDLELRFSASLRLMDFDRDEVDLAIRFGQGGDEGLYSRTLIREWLTPMMTPQMAKGLRAPEDLLDLPLIHQDDIGFLEPPMGWPAWFRAVGVEPPEMAGPHFSQADHAVNAALAGAGVVLGRVSLAESHLREGQLVMPFARALWANATYRIICPEGAETRPPVARFIELITREVEDIDELTATRDFGGADET
ncbi:transcriptional regulator GcvA [Aestuariibius insulae]|uniref:transcriptional regulator GcvA n=1 Tax=Aestuariibius insulae TaxID=2058287 RepID=UPI00345E8DA6